jgi:RNA ligase
MIDFNNLQKMIEQKYISVQKHPTEDLWIYNYTQKAQFDRVWNNETLNCRGLILDADKNIVARPFSKFFNLDEAINQGEQLPLEDFVVQEKFDGSLGILYWDKMDSPWLATRGSFISDQAIEGTQLLSNYGPYLHELNRNYTYLFEIIYPENRIVVDYQGRRDLILLAVIDTQTGEEKNLYEECSGFPFAGYINGITDYKNLKDLTEDNKEGFVIRFKSGKRYKVKFDEYTRLHRLITGINARTIWDILRNNQPIDELLDRVPDEFFNWVRKTVRELKDKYQIISSRAYHAYIEVDRKTETRKDFALYVLKNYKDISQLLFAYKGNKDIAPMIWRMLKPVHESPFKIET